MFLFSQGGDSTTSFLQAAERLFVVAEALDDELYNLRIFRQLVHDLSEGLSKELSITGRNIDTLLPFYATWVKWGSSALQKRIIDAIRDDLEDKGGLFSFEEVKYIFETTNEAGPGDPLRELAVALTYYQRFGCQGHLPSGQVLCASDVSRLFKEIDGFMDRYLEFEDRDNAFRCAPPQDPRDRGAAMSSCYFHAHKVGEPCYMRQIEE